MLNVIWLAEIPHNTIPLYDGAYQTVPHDTYSDKYGEYCCYNNTC